MIGELMTLLALVFVGFWAFQIGVYQGEKKKLEVVKKPPVLHWNAGLIARMKYWDMTVKGDYEDMIKKMTASEPQG